MTDEELQALKNKHKGNIDRRTIDAPTELRSDDTGVFFGYAALFNTRTTIQTWWDDSFDEQIAPGAFSRAISENQDVRALINHDANHVIGRTKSGTLRITEDSTGLRFEVDAPNTQDANDLKELIKRGDISGCSFAFQVITDEWTRSGDTPLRTIKDLNLMDVSIVTYPAYDDTTVSARALDSIKELTALEVPTFQDDSGALDILRMKIDLSERY